MRRLPALKIPGRQECRTTTPHHRRLAHKSGYNLHSHRICVSRIFGERFKYAKRIGLLPAFRRILKARGLACVHVDLDADSLKPVLGAHNSPRMASTPHKAARIEGVTICFVRQDKSGAQTKAAHGRLCGSGNSHKLAILLGGSPPSVMATFDNRRVDFHMKEPFDAVLSCTVFYG